MLLFGFTTAQTSKETKHAATPNVKILSSEINIIIETANTNTHNVKVKVKVKVKCTLVQALR